MTTGPPEDPTRRLLRQYDELAQLAGALAHEIKNPLSVIRMNVDLLAEDVGQMPLADRRRLMGKIDTVQGQCERLQYLVDDFLKFARLRQLELSPGSLNDQIERVLQLVAALAQRAKIEIVRYLDPELPNILLDEQTLQAALHNLVKNALEAMPGGGQLTARTRPTRHGVALDLIDTGCGMDETTALRMFEAFFSTKEGGSGLGLPIARKVIEAHGGRIDVQSAIGRGTQFTIEFPTPARIPPTQPAWTAV